MSVGARQSQLLVTIHNLQGYSNIAHHTEYDRYNIPRKQAIMAKLDPKTELSVVVRIRASWCSLIDAVCWVAVQPGMGVGDGW